MKSRTPGQTNLSIKDIHTEMIKVLKAILKMKVFSILCKTSEKPGLTGGEEVGDDVGGGMSGQHLQV